ncbi:MAG: secondary thiamine-phosphate synthase enzyme YjbQ [Euryarchaeota archaeon]|nr:secondary thiamine-phosphate synthase enzyme YjbQ [Euryarchaeota archaeon]
MEHFTVSTQNECTLINITDRVKDAVTGRGAVLVFTPHTTCSLLINEDEPGLREDILQFYATLAPKGNYNHNKVDNNAHSHLRSLFNTGVTIPVNNGELSLGRWQSIFLMEQDGPRKRKVYIQMILSE